MKALKDKKKFGKDKKPKNRLCLKFGYCYGKEYRKYKRQTIKAIKHKLLFKISLSEEEAKIVKLWNLYLK